MRWVLIVSLILMTVPGYCRDGVRARKVVADSTPIVIQTTDVFPANVGVAYSGTFAATGGSGSYTWSVVAGSLPPGMTLTPSTGALSGTPTVVGWYPFSIEATDTSHRETNVLPYSIIVTPLLDIYGGAAGVACGTATGYFFAQKTGSRWWLCDPLGNKFFLNAIGSMTDAGGSGYDAIATAKYGDVGYTWAPQQNRRSQMWGFNTVGELSNGDTWPSATCTACGWTGDVQPVKMPFIPDIGGLSSYAARNVYGYANDAVKDLIYGANANYTGWRSGLLDFYDPNHRMWIDHDLGTDPAWTPAENNAYTVGWLIDDIDWVWGFGAGPDFQTIGASGHNNDDVAYIVLISSPVQIFNPAPVGYTPGTIYSDTKVYSKTAMASPPAACAMLTPCSLRDYLYQKYGGSIASLNAAWGSTYTTFDSSGVQVTGESIATGDGTTTAFSHVLGHIPVAPLSIEVSVAGAAQGGDCPWWDKSYCLTTTTGFGTIMGPPTSSLPTAKPDQYSLALQSCGACALPAANYWAKVYFHMNPGYISYPSTEVSTESAAGQQIIVYTPDNPSGDATGYDVYVSTRALGDNSGIGNETLQASNVPFGTNWVEPTTGIVTGASMPPLPTSIDYATGQLTITFGTAPASGAAITVSYIYNGWASGGTGLMDEDGSHTAWVGTNSICLTPAGACDGTYLPLPNANATLGADLDAWNAQFASFYFNTVRSEIKKYSPKTLYLGIDSLGSWYVPPRKEILQAAALYCDAGFTALPPNQAMLNFTAQYFGDRPLINFFDFSANADSSIGSAGSALPGENFPTQAARGQFVEGAVNSMITSTAAPTNSYPWVGWVWWGLVDYYPNEDTDWGLVSLIDNPYDGKSSSVTVRRDPWGFTTGAEKLNFGDVIDYVKQANALWYQYAH